MSLQRQLRRKLAVAIQNQNYPALEELQTKIGKLLDKPHNLVLLSDAYKYSHHKFYPEGITMVHSYLESRGGVFAETVFTELQVFIKKYLAGVAILPEEIDEAEKILNGPNGVFGRDDVFDRSKFDYIVEKHGGRLPIRIKAVPEGTPVTVSNVLMCIENTDDNCAWLTNFLESLLLQVWYPTTVATLSREVKKIVKSYWDKGTSYDEATKDFLIGFVLNDFGFRGVSSVESAMHGGMAHLINFDGSDNTIASKGIMDYYNTDTVYGKSVPACYDDKTEVLTNEGWKLFKNLSKEELIAEYKENGEIDFVKPIKYYECNYNGKLHQYTNGKGYNYVNNLVTPNHKMVVKNSSNKITLKISEDETWNYSDKLKYVISGNKVYGYRKLPYIDQLRIAFQADGSFPSDKENYDGSRGGKYPIRFSLKKDRKKDRLTMLLDNLKFKYTLNKDSNGYYNFWINSEVEMFKDFRWINLNNVSKGYGKEFIEELKHWDGTKKNNTIVYTTINYENIGPLQAISALSDIKTYYTSYDDKRNDNSRKLLHCLNFKFEKTYVGGKNILKENIDYNGKVYCVSVPSKMLITKRNNIVSICGNTEHSIMSILGPKGEIDMMRRTLDMFPEGIVACVSDTFNIKDAIYNKWGGELKDKILSRPDAPGNQLVIRPDSGHVLKTLEMIFEGLFDSFGYTTNEKGYKVLPSQVRVIQGDGVNINSITEILEWMDVERISPENLVFGMGGKLLQADINRDTQKFATKASYAVINGEEYTVVKSPTEIDENGNQTPSFKKSKQGLLKLVKNDDGSYRSVTSLASDYDTVKDELVVVFENGEIIKEYTFDEVRKNAALVPNVKKELI